MSKKEQKWGITRIATRLLGFLKPYWGLAFLCVLLQAGFRALHLVNPWVEGQLLDRVFGQIYADYLYIIVCFMSLEEIADELISIYDISSEILWKDIEVLVHTLIEKDIITILK